MHLDILTVEYEIALFDINMNNYIEISIPIHYRKHAKVRKAFFTHAKAAHVPNVARLVRNDKTQRLLKCTFSLCGFCEEAETCPSHL